MQTNSAASSECSGRAVGARGRGPDADEQRLRPPRRASLRAEARQRAGVGPRAQLIEDDTDKKQGRVTCVTRPWHV